MKIIVTKYIPTYMYILFTVYHYILIFYFCIKTFWMFISFVEEIKNCDERLYSVYYILDGF
jgi:hypothetical protein